MPVDFYGIPVDQSTIGRSRAPSEFIALSGCASASGRAAGSGKVLCKSHQNATYVELPDRKSLRNFAKAEY
jgi:hypothetical protein